jgi:hypothetical protein
VENVWWWKKLQPRARVSLGGKLLAVENVTSENISQWKIPQGGKCLEVPKAATSVKK